MTSAHDEYLGGARGGRIPHACHRHAHAAYVAGIGWQARLMVSTFFILVSYRPHWEWVEHGLSIVKPVAKLRVQTTGKETMNVFVYINTRFAPRTLMPTAESS